MRRDLICFDTKAVAVSGSEFMLRGGAALIRRLQPPFNGKRIALVHAFAVKISLADIELFFGIIFFIE